MTRGTSRPGASTSFSEAANRRLALTRDQILAHRRRVGALDERLPPGPESLRRAAWAGLTDSMPRAALLSIHARVAGTQANSWENPSLAQLWGPRFSVYVVPREDLAVFSLGRYSEAGPSRREADDLAARLAGVSGGRRILHDDAGAGVGVHPNRLRYAATTGTVLIRWAGARQATVWTVARPEIEPHDARLELARRYLHVLGPGTPEGFARWAGIGTPDARRAFDDLDAELTQVRTPIGEAWIQSADEESFRAPGGQPAPARLLPSGDAYYLFWAADRELLVPDADRRALLWTSRVWPGAILVDGEIVGTWRRADANLTLEPWRQLTAEERGAVEEEAQSLPLPDVQSRIRVSGAEA